MGAVAQTTILELKHDTKKSGKLIARCEELKNSNGKQCFNHSLLQYEI